MRRARYAVLGTAMVLSAVLIVSAGSPASSKDEIAGTVTGVRGKVERTKIGSGRAEPVRLHDVYRVGEVLETGSDAAVQLSLSDETFLNLAADSAVRVNQYAFDRSTMRRTARVRVLKGLVRVVLIRHRSADSLFYLETEQASILPEMIADIVVEARQEETLVTVLGGSAGVKNVSAYVIGEMRVGINRAITVRAKTPPASPVAVPADERQRLLRRLKVP